MSTERNLFGEDDFPTTTSTQDREEWLPPYHFQPSRLRSLYSRLLHLASRIALPVEEKGRETSGTDGPIPGVSFARFDPNGLCWRTSQTCLTAMIGDTSEAFSPIWPRWGIVSDGAAFRLPKWEFRISESDCSFWPTSTMQNSENNAGPSQYHRNTPPLNTAVNLWPTPQVSDAERGWSRTCAAKKRDGLGRKSGAAIGHKLSAEPELLPEIEAAGKASHLNPDWVDALQGFPIGWSDKNIPLTGDSDSTSGNRRGSVWERRTGGDG